ncbi:MAG: hypothetical protein Q4C64_01615 [Erysipelotrichia bacterium]|nr:hypothetical protein [Erysipelotrichia bacterium]
MNKYILGLFISLVAIIYTIYRYKKQNELLSTIKLNQYQQLPMFSHYFGLIVILAVFSLFCLYIGIKEDNYALTVVSIGIFVECICETVYNRKFMIFYYNDSRCIIDGKQIQYNNIKRCYRKSSLPLSKVTVELYNGEKKTVYPYALAILNDKVK